MDKSTPKVSVVMSVYNGLPYLQESIESILNQTFTDFEFIIINDCSTDNTWDVLKQYAEQDQRIKLFNNNENIGLTKSLNKALKLAQGEYIARQDADDVSLPLRFEKQVALLDKHPEFILASCNIELINAEGSYVGKYQRACDADLVPWYLLFHNRLAGHSQVMFRWQSIMNVGGYSEVRPYSQDYELWCRLVKVGKIAILPQVLQKQRIHSGSISSEKRLEQKNYSINQTRHNIKQLIGEEISLEEAEDLRGFWLGYWWSHRFPDAKKAGILHSRLQEIYQKFIQQNAQQSSFYPHKSLQLRLLIGQQFLYWIQVPLSSQHSLLSKLKISHYALKWNPLGVPSSWLKWFWKLPSQMLRTIIRRITPKEQISIS